MNDLEGLPSPRDLEFFQENGYWLSPQLFSDEELQGFREHHALVVAGEYETGRPPLSRAPEPGDTSRLVQVNNAYYTDATIARLVLDERIGRIAARLSGVDGVRLWHDQLLFKPPESGAAGNIGWHQDAGYWQCTDRVEQALTAWVALDDVDEENGAMEVVPGSHRWGLLGEEHFFASDIEAQTAAIEKRTGRTMETVACNLKAGCVSFHHSHTIHGSRENRSTRPRISIAIHMIPDGTRYSTKVRSGHSSISLCQPRDGEPFAGPYFPVIYREGDALANVWITT